MGISLLYKKYLKKKIMRLAGCVEEIWRNRNAYRNVVGTTEEKMQQQSVSVDERIILKGILTFC